MVHNVISRILTEDGVGAFRAVALDENDLPLALFLDRWVERGKRVHWGDVYTGHIAKLAPQQGGGFARLDNGHEIFIRNNSLQNIAEGAAVNVLIESEARRDKLARGKVVKKSATARDAFQRWMEGLPGSEGAKVGAVKPGDHIVKATFANALSSIVVLPGGGRVRFVETPALVAVDIDTVGRKDKGRAFDRALKINKCAAQEAARQLSLRGLGGAIVLDCISPIAKTAGTHIKQEFLSSFRAICSRRAEALAPSPFGLMEAALAWRERPLAHAVLDENGTPTNQSRLLTAVRSLERELVVNRAGSFRLELPRAVGKFQEKEIASYLQELSNRYGARMSIILTDVGKAEVFKI